MTDEWVSTREAAKRLRVAESTVYRWLADPDVRAERWGAEGVGWRRRPALRRKIYQVSATRVEQLADAGSTSQ